MKGTKKGDLRKDTFFFFFFLVVTFKTQNILGFA